MADIIHRVGIKASPHNVFAALSTIMDLLVGGQRTRQVPPTSARPLRFNFTISKGRS